MVILDVANLTFFKSLRAVQMTTIATQEVLNQYLQEAMGCRWAAIMALKKGEIGDIKYNS